MMNIMPVLFYYRNDRGDL